MIILPSLKIYLYHTPILAVQASEHATTLIWPVHLFHVSINTIDVASSFVGSLQLLAIPRN